MAKAVARLALVLLLWSAVSLAQSASTVSLTPRGQPTSALLAESAADETLTIPAATEAAVQLLSGIHTQVSHVDDPIRAELVQPVSVNGRVALPPGTLLDGRITHISS
ncbi:MAG: hypothetical protein HYS33_07250, partial [Acidobacteria bacterium]|nr:hypothetical protein [Acidobacteriota bacterium]